jgi:hypothetical protein
MVAARYRGRLTREVTVTGERSWLYPAQGEDGALWQVIESAEDKAPAKEADGSVDVSIGPTAPAGKESNWIPTPKGTPWFPLLRFYGPLEPWIDRELEA